MLISLHVKNLALIEEAEVNFGKGLNILTGETGAGKSIIMGSIGLALGERADKDMIRTGAEYALVELLFQAQSLEQKQVLLNMDFPVEEDGIVLIQRKIMPNRNISKVCGETATAKQLKDIASCFIDIHGQHENQVLLHRKKHLEILDEFAEDEIKSIHSLLGASYKKYVELKKEWEGTLTDENSRQKEIELTSFVVNEIEAARLVPGEDITLETTYKKMSNGKRIMEAVSDAYLYLAGEEGASNALSRAVKEMNAVISFDLELNDIFEQMNTLEAMMFDVCRFMESYQEELEYDESDFVEIEQRLNLLNQFKVKYGQSIEKIIEFKEKQEEKLQKLLDYDSYKLDLQKRLELAEEELDSLCQKASKCRNTNARILEEKMVKALCDLNFTHVNFEISITKKTEGYSDIGWDEVSFLISTNPGEPVKPLENTASGGELSRFMLALKTIMATKEKIPTLIFDEIDAGISGKTAWKVSENLAVLGENHQVICITHLPQIAAMADSHFVIEKESIDKTTVTSIRELAEDETITELARLLGGMEVTNAVLSNAKELRELANSTKNY